MRVKIYSIFDHATQNYGQPFPSANDRAAERSFAALVANPTSMCCSCPTDFSLYHLAEFDDEIGGYTNCIPPNLICNATKFGV
jgi:hypothetical protein